MAKKTPEVAKKQVVQTTEQLALMLNQQYTTLIQCQQQIQAINAELQRREQANLKED
jgi:hypothetical protein